MQLNLTNHDPQTGRFIKPWKVVEHAAFTTRPARWALTVDYPIMRETHNWWWVETREGGPSKVLLTTAARTHSCGFPVTITDPMGRRYEWPLVPAEWRTVI